MQRWHASRVPHSFIAQHLTVLRRDDEMSMLLLQSGADAFIADRDGQNAVSLASKRQRTVLFANMDR